MQGWFNSFLYFNYFSISRNRNSSSFPFKWNFHGDWYFSPSDVWGPGKPPAERCALVPFLSPFLFFFACPVCASSPLRDILALFLFFSFFFFWLSFLRPSRQQTTWRAPRTLCPREEARRFSKLLNVSRLVSSFSFDRIREGKRWTFASVLSVIISCEGHGNERRNKFFDRFIIEGCEDRIIWMDGMAGTRAKSLFRSDLSDGRFLSTFSKEKIF